jgi:hypothetical protein
VAGGAVGGVGGAGPTVTLERGFRRLTIVISFLVLGLAVAINAIGWSSFGPDVTVQATLDDGRKVLLDGREDHLTNRDILTSQLLQRNELKPTGKPGSAGGVMLNSVVDIRVVRRPPNAWWTQTWVTRLAVVVVGLLWAVFYVVRWIGRGFTGAW